MARITTQRGLDRIVNFSDAVVAIALTLMVLPLTDLAGQSRTEGLKAVLAEHAPVILSFAVSFVVIAVIWTEHHRLFESLVTYDGPVLVLSFVWLFGIVLIPFTTAVTQEEPASDRLSSVLYIGNLLLAFLILAAMHLIARYDSRIMDPDRVADFRIGPSIALAAISAVALAVAVTVPAIGRWAVFLLVLADPVALVFRKRPHGGRP